MKKLVIIRFGSDEPLVLQNGDAYDSTMEIIDNENRTLTRYRHINTDFSRKYIGNGGILQEGIYGGMYLTQWGKLHNCVVIMKLTSLARVYTMPDICLFDITLPSIISNPVNDGKRIIVGTAIHAGGSYTDFSRGCITIAPDEYPDWKSHFKDSEKVIIELTRKNSVVPPEFYTEESKFI